MIRETVLVVGGKGQVGSEVARILAGQGYKVITTSSKAPAAGVSANANIRHLNMATGEGLHAAFEGVDRAFLLSPAGYADQYAMLSPLVQESKRRGLKKVVLMTAMGADAVETSPFRRVELELERSGLNYAILRPNWFLQNFNSFWISGILSAGKIFLPAGSARVSFIDARDISEVAARVLASDEAPLSGRAFDLTGGAAVDHAGVARALSSESGREIGYQEISVEEFRSGLLGAGLPADYTEFLIMIMGFLREGYAARVTTSVRDILGREPRSLEEYARDYRSAFAPLSKTVSL